MLRLLGLMPPIEPSEQEIAAARIQRQTGYTPETIAGFERALRERDQQLRVLEETLTRRILLLQKERDEYLMGNDDVGISERAPLRPASTNDAVQQAAVAAASAAAGDPHHASHSHH